ncbi:MAG: methyltransferase domain-containing protein [Chloroflexi bacterium]|nr:MAG: methyltransferase domain-containing protein [Chloroflexota bacterium]
MHLCGLGIIFRTRHVNCPLCNHDSNVLFEKDGYPIRECVHCHHQYAELDLTPTHPTQIYDDSYFFDGGDGYPNYLREAELLIEHGRRYAKLLRHYTDVGTVFDVGSAAGFILKGFAEAGWQAYGIEPNDSMAAYAREVLHLDVTTGALEEFEMPHQFDLVTMIQVIAHFYDVRQAFDVVSRGLRSGGLLLIETWDRDSFPARMLGANWHEYSPPSVVHWFSLDGLNWFLQSYGFEAIAHGRPSKWLKGVHAKSLVRYKLDDIAGGKHLTHLVRAIPDNIKIPYPFFDLFWGLYKRL